MAYIVMASAIMDYAIIAYILTAHIVLYSYGLHSSRVCSYGLDSYGRHGNGTRTPRYAPRAGCSIPRPEQSVGMCTDTRQLLALGTRRAPFGQRPTEAVVFGAPMPVLTY